MHTIWQNCHQELFWAPKCQKFGILTVKITCGNLPFNFPQPIATDKCLVSRRRAESITDLCFSHG
jgi:hypothetical protein